MIRETNSEISGESLDNGKKYWKSLEDLSDTPGFRSWVEREFPQGASMLEGVERRGFMKVMAASFGLAGLGMTGCRRPEHAILPYGKSPEELIPGVPNYYATSMPTAQGNIPLVVESHSGRPTKIEGNPTYLSYGGSTDVYAQASVLELYDPDRARGSFSKNKGTDDSFTWSSADTLSLVDKVSKWVDGGKTAILSDRSFSKARAELAGQLGKKGVEWFEFDAIDLLQSEKNLGKGLGLSSNLRALPSPGKASRVLTLDCDFLGYREPYSLANSRSFMAGRRVRPGLSEEDRKKDIKKMNRLYSVEADLTTAGSVADHRLRLESSQIPAFSCLFAAEVLTLTNHKDKSLISRLQELGQEANASGDWIEWIKPCAADLCSKPKLSLVLAGSHLPEEVHVAAFLINQSLGAIGTTVNYLPTTHYPESLTSLVEKIEGDEVKNLLIVGGNPVFLSGSFVKWDALREKLENVARLGYSIDESSEFADFHIGQSHYLESWDLAGTWDEKAIVPVQPLLAPLFDTVSDLDALLSISSSDQNAHGFIKTIHSEIENAKPFDDFLRLGVHELEPSFFENSVELGNYFDELQLENSSPDRDNLDLLLVPDFHSWDGRFVNNGWMQECPHPITKLTWDNAILISPKLAVKLQDDDAGIGLIPKATMLNDSGQIAPDNANFAGGKQNAPVVRIEFGPDLSIEGPLYVQPGLADHSLVASLGMGRRKTGRVGVSVTSKSLP